MKRLRWGLLIVALVACLLAVGCGGDDTPAADDESTVAPTDEANTDESTVASTDEPNAGEIGKENETETEADTSHLVSEDPKGTSPYGCTYISNGDGTCYISNVQFYEEFLDGELTLSFPEKSPVGDTVTAVRYEVRGDLVPRALTDEDFLHYILQPLMERAELEAVDSTDAISSSQMTEEQYTQTIPFNVRQLIAFYGGRDGKKGIALEKTDALKKSLIDEYPFLKEHPDTEFWVFDTSSSDSQIARQSETLKTIGMTSAMASEMEVRVGYAKSNLAVRYCENVVSMEFPNTVTEISGSVFGYCSSLRSLKLPDEVKVTGELSYKAEFSNTAYYHDDANWTDGWLYVGTALVGCKKDKTGAVTIKDGTTIIANGAFAGLSGLTSVTIPDSVTGIGDYAFYQCGSLTNITIPDSVTNIGNSAFFGCIGLTNITLPDSVTDIGNYAFHNCSGLTSVTIPDSVTGIGDYAFYQCRSLTSITIPDSVTSIGGSAFEGCSGLTSITIPDSVTSIGGSAFENCAKLTSITIPDGVTSIGGGAFDGCSGLTSITIPDKVTFIGNYPFKHCTGLTSIKVSKGNAMYHAAGNCLIETASKTLIAGCKNSVIPTDSSVTGICGYAFYGCSDLTSITIPDSVISIGNYAFEDCTGLKSVTIGNGVTNIDWSAFKGCTGLTSITIPDSVTSISNSAFEDCTGLTSVTIGNGATSIGNSAFSGCTGLTSITIPDSVTYIGGEAFSGCTSLTSVTIGSGVTEMNGKVFPNCPNLARITVAKGNTVYHATGSCLIETAGKTLITGCKNSVIPTDGSVISIASEAFSGCIGLTSITIPDSVTDIGREAFSGCTGLMSITIPDSVTDMGEDAFSGCSSLERIIIGTGVTCINDVMLSGCTALKSITIPASVTSIDETAFDDCTNLTSVHITDIASWCNIEFSSYKSNPLFKAHNLYLDDQLVTSLVIPEGVTSISQYAFVGCESFTSVTIPDSVTQIGQRAFGSCSGLKSVTMGASVTKISNVAFEQCKSLTDITFAGTMEQWQSIKKIANWKFGTASFTVHCTDGDISKADA